MLFTNNENKSGDKWSSYGTIKRNKKLLENTPNTLTIKCPSQRNDVNHKVRGSSKPDK